MFNRRNLSMALAAASVAGTACAPVIRGLSGEPVTPDLTSTVAPEVRLSIEDHDVVWPYGDFVVRGEDAEAVVDRDLLVLAVADHAGGVASLAFDNMELLPTCIGPAGRGPGMRIALTGERLVDDTPTDGRTRMTVIQRIVISEGSLCPGVRLIDIELRVRARATNFAGVEAQTGEATLRLQRPSSGSGTGSPSPAPEPSPSPSPEPTPDPDPCANAGAACAVQPSECFGRGEDWTVQGRQVCRNGRLRCEAQVGTDYCTGCGGVCGGCPGNSCSATIPCAPGGACGAGSGGAAPGRCGSLTVPEPSGYVPCRVISGACWIPSEAGTQVICSP